MSDPNLVPPVFPPFETEHGESLADTEPEGIETEGDPWPWGVRLFALAIIGLLLAAAAIPFSTDLAVWILVVTIGPVLALFAGVVLWFLGRAVITGSFDR